jgi:hypothetical protein
MNTPEFDLLLSLARTMPDEERANAILNAGVNWRAFQDLAMRHGVRPLVYRSLLNVCWDRVPEDIQIAWQAIDRRIIQRNRLATAELLRIAAAFRTAEVPLVALKGPILAEMAYGDYTLREFSDLDLLIRVGDFKKAHGLVTRLGYRPVLDMDCDQALEFLRNQGESTFNSSFGGPQVDLHWRVAPKHTALSLEADYFWPRFRPVQIAGEYVLSFAPQDLPLYLASQGGHDQWGDLPRLCDLAEFLRTHKDLDWPQLLEAGRGSHGLRMLLLGLQLAHELLGLQIPPAVAELISKEQAVPRLAVQAVAKLARPDPPGAVAQFVFQIDAKERWQEKVSLIAGRLTDRTDSDAQWMLLPKPAWWLYPALRPLRMFGKLLLSRD